MGACATLSPNNESQDPFLEKNSKINGLEGSFVDLKIHTQKVQAL